MSSSAKSASKASFKKYEVEDYERRRYRGLDQRIVHKREVRLIRKVLKIIDKEKSEGGRLSLDLPCGYGRFANLFEGSGLRLVNSDLSFHMVKRAGEKADSLDRPLGVVADAKQGLPFKSGIFDRIFSIRFFHHLHQPEDRKAVLKEFSRVSSEWIVLSFYRMNALHFFQRRLRRLIKKSRTEIKMISPLQFEKEVNEAGLRILKTFPLLRGIHAYYIALLKK